MNRFFGAIQRWVFSTYYTPYKKMKSHSKIPPQLLEQLKKLEIRAFTLGASGADSVASIVKIWEGIIKIEKSEKDAEFQEKEAFTKALISELEGQVNAQSQREFSDNERQQSKEVENVKLLALQKKYGEKSELLKNLQEEKRELLARLNAFKSKKENPPVAKSIMDTKKAAIGTFLGMMLIEGSITYMAIENLGLLPSIGIIIFILIYGGLIGTLCHLSGFYHAQGRRWASLKSAAGAYLLAISIILLRNHAQNEGYDWILNGINLLFVYACITISNRLHERREFWRIKEAITKLVKRIDKLNAELKLYPSERQAVKDQSGALVSRKVQDHLKTTRSTLSGQRKILAGLQARRQNILLRIEAYRMEGISALEQSFREGQNS